MAEQQPTESKPVESLPERSKEVADAAAAGEKGPSKNELKKLAKEKEKVGQISHATTNTGLICNQGRKSCKA